MSALSFWSQAKTTWPTLSWDGGGEEVTHTPLSFSDERRAPLVESLDLCERKGGVAEGTSHMAKFSHHIRHPRGDAERQGNENRQESTLSFL